MILSTGRWPDGCHFSKARGKGKVADDAKDEAVDEGYSTARGENETDGSSEGNPSTTHLSVIEYPSEEDYLLEDGKGHGHHGQPRQSRL